MTEFQTTPDDTPEIRASDIQPSWAGFGGSQSALAGDAFMGGMRTLKRIHENQQALSGEESLGSQIGRLRGGEDLNQVLDSPRKAATITPDEATARVKQEGLEGRLPHPSTNSAALELQLAQAHEERDREVALARGPNGFVPGALGLVTSLGVGMIDPVNVAAFSIPVMGEARMGMLMARAGDSILARGAVRTGIGAAQGAVGGAALAPADWWLKTQDGQDYTMADALHSVVMSAGMGATFHAGFGSVGDILSRRRGAPLSGSIEDLRARAIAGDTHAADIVEHLGNAGTHVSAAALESDGVAAEDIPGIATPAAARPAARPEHPAEILADLPPQAREDTVRAAMADVIAGRPVRAAEMLQEAAKEDPRIAESLPPVEAYHGTPHEFDRFDISKIGTGEGAQSYGHGLYFAENENVARSYQLMGDATVDGQRYDPNNPVHKAVSLVDEFGSREAAIREAKARIEHDLGDFYRDVLRHLESDKPLPTMETGGRMYKVHIAADREHFLDWDKPLSEQSEHVRNVLLKHPNEAIAGTAAKWGHDVPAMYARIGQRLGEENLGPEGSGKTIAEAGRAAASERLAEAGIPGIKYLDQGSRRVGGIRDIPQPVHDALKAMDYLGYDSAGAALRDIRSERKLGNDWKDVWDGHHPEDAAHARVVDDYLNGVEKYETRNFVVFDDKLIRITHKNGKEVGLDEMKAAQGSGVPGIDNSRDVVSGANSSRDPNGPVYIDRHIPQFSPALKDRSGQPANLWKYLAIHEREEAKAMAAGMSYDDAHAKRATPAERAAVEADGVDWTAYTHEMDGYLAAIEHEKAANPPPDTHVDPQQAIGHHRSENKQGAPEKVTPIPAARKAGGPRSRPEATWSLFEFLAARGGLREDDPLIADLRSSLGGANKFVPGFGNLIRKPRQLSTADRMGGKSAPMSLDQAREAAVEAGYLFDIGHVTGAQAQTTVRTLLDAADEEARGKRVYRQGTQAPHAEIDRGQQEHEMEGALDQALEKVGIQPSEVAPELRARTIEIMDKEHVTDPVDAYERAVMEETQHGAQAGQHQRIAEEIRGWDVPPDAGAAPRAGGAPAAEPEPQVAGTREAPRAPGQADRAPGRPAGGVKADFRKFADAPHPIEDPELASASKVAEKTPEPKSLDSGKAVSEAVKAATEADKLLADILPSLSDDERIKFEDALRNLDLDREAHEQIVREGAACLAAAVA